MDRNKHHIYFRIMALVFALLVFSFFSSGPAEIIMPGSFSEYLPGEENTVRAASVDDTASGLDNRPMSARVLGMGGAFTAVADDNSALVYNPAGLAANGTGGLMLSGGAGAEDIREFRSRLETGEDFLVNDDFDDPEDFVEDLPESLSASAEGLASIGLGTSAVGGDLRAAADGVADSEDVEVEINYLSNANVRLGLSSEIFRVPAEVGTATYGINLRYNRIDTGNYEIYEANENNEPVYRRETQELDGSGLALDGGLLLQLTPMVHMGVMVDNVLAQDIELSGSREVYEYSYDNGDEWEKDDERSDPNYTEDYSPSRRGRIGIAARVPVIGTTFALDLENAPVLSDTDEDPVLFIGAENEMIFDTIRLRAGTYSRENRVFTAGAGINLGGASVDLGAGHSPGGDFTRAQIQLGLGF